MLQTETPITTTTTVVVFLVSCVFLLELAMMFEGLFGEKIVPRVLGVFFGPLY